MCFTYMIHVLTVLCKCHRIICMEKNSEEYIALRDKCIQKYRKLCKDSVVFDLCEVDKQTRVMFLEDEVYLMKTKAMKAASFEQQIDILDQVIAGTFGDPERGEQTTNILKAMNMKQEILLNDIGINDDVKNALNIAFVPMAKDDFTALGTIEVNEGNGSTELSSTFGMSDDALSAEEKAKRMLLDMQNGGDNGNA